MKISNQAPSYLKPWWNDVLANDLDRDAVLQAVKHLLSPLWTPLIPGSPVVVTDDAGKPITETDVAETLLQCTGDTVNVDAENFMRAFYSQTMSDYDKRLSADCVFTAQANVTANCPPPAANVFYIPDDLRSACRKYLADPIHMQAFLQCTESFVLPEPHVGVYFLSRPVFDDYKDYVKTFVQSISANLSADVLQKFSDFYNCTLNILEGVVLRATDTDSLESYSFPRVLHMATLSFLQDPRGKNAGLITPYVSELICPKSMVFLDVEQCARTPKNVLDRLVKDFQDVMREKVNPVQLQKLSTMTAAAVAKQRIKGQLANYRDILNENGGEKRALFLFRKGAVSQKDLCKTIKRIIVKQYNVAMSENCTKNVSYSYHRPNRRQPENFAMKGRSVKTIYKPDIHVYLDTSGSISENNYKQGILTCIYMAIKLNVNIYFNSFATDISQCAKLNTRNKSLGEAYKQFQSIPKVGGGTNIHKVWSYIMQDPKRIKELSFLITDFEYTPPSKVPVYPDKLWYIPITTDPNDWGDIRKNAEDFCQAMFHIDNGIRSKMIM